MSYHNFIDEEGNSFGSFEVFEDGPDIPEFGTEPGNFDSNGEPTKEGFYWWPCFPGCLPDTEDDPTGPFTSYDAAFQDAQEFAKGGN